MSSQLFRNRVETGELLAERLSQYRNRNYMVVLAPPRGGVLGSLLGKPLVGSPA